MKNYLFPIFAVYALIIVFAVVACVSTSVVISAVCAVLFFGCIFSLPALCEREIKD